MPTPKRLLKTASNFVLGSIESSTYPLPGTSCLGSLGWVGENGYAFRFLLACGLVERPF